MDEEARAAIRQVADVVSKHTSAAQILTGLHLETLLILMEKGLLTAQQCLERLLRVRDAQASQPELAPAVALTDSLVGIVRRLAARGYPGQNAPKQEEEAQDELKFLRGWETKGPAN